VIGAALVVVVGAFAGAPLPAADAVASDVEFAGFHHGAASAGVPPPPREDFACWPFGLGLLGVVVGGVGAGVAWAGMLAAAATQCGPDDLCEGVNGALLSTPMIMAAGAGVGGLVGVVWGGSIAVDERAEEPERSEDHR
jgi:hypothetical protein